MITLSTYVGPKHKNIADYYVGGRKLPWWAVGISTMATQTSAISFISIPAFVALKNGGGLTWLQYELGVPIAIIFVIAFLIPNFRKLKLISVYEYLEQRFNSNVRKLVCIVFLISRGIGTSVGVYAIAIILSVCMNLPLWITILIIGLVTVIYDTIGGMTAVVYSDVIQTVILIGGIGLCIYYATHVSGGLTETLAAFPTERYKTIDLSLGIHSSSKATFWAFLFGGIFLYMSYYGTDQSQVQRELSAKTADESRKSLLFNGLARFPLTLLYAWLGISLFSALRHMPAMQDGIEHAKPDYLVPYFILTLPVGIRGLLFASLLAAAMSSLDSALNSLSAVTMRDFMEKKLSNTKRHIAYSKWITLFWGIFITGFAFIVGNIAETVIEGINKIGSAFYGPVLASFLVGILSKRTNAKGVFSGIIAGVCINIAIWILLPAINWMWWNVFGVITTSSVALFVGSSNKVFNTSKVISINRWKTGYSILTIYFLIMLLILFCIARYS